MESTLLTRNQPGFGTGEFPDRIQTLRTPCKPLVAASRGAEAHELQPLHTSRDSWGAGACVCVPASPQDALIPKMGREGKDGVVAEQAQGKGGSGRARGQRVVGAQAGLRWGFGGRLGWDGCPEARRVQSGASPFAQEKGAGLTYSSVKLRKTQ